MPLAIWDPNDPDGLYCRNRDEAAGWAHQHLPDGGHSVTRADFYLIDGEPVAVLHCIQYHEDGRAVINPITGGIARESGRFPLDELPPAHLLRKP